MDASRNSFLLWQDYFDEASVKHRNQEDALPTENASAISLDAVGSLSADVRSYDDAVAFEGHLSNCTAVASKLGNAVRRSEIPLATKNLLEVTDGLRRPP